MLKLFQKFVPEVVVNETMKQEGSPIFEGETRYVTVLFSDLRGFTPMSENMTPKEVVTFLNNYYSIMSNIIKKYTGNVMQFVGDEIFASFGAPEAIPDPEKSAVFCALEMMDATKKLQDVSGRDISMGIGINAGEVITGNLGSEDRINYCATGDTVNTGKRIETLTKTQENTIYISKSVYTKVKKVVHVEELPLQVVKGKKDPIEVFRLVSRVNEPAVK
jgi:class 3 adenylate cyclase